MSNLDPLKPSTPEQNGIPSEAVLRFFKRLEDKRLCMHSVMMVRRGNVVAEAYWKPFDAAFRHRMYSTSKSFVSVAIGILAGEGKLGLADKVVDFFPEFKDRPVHPYTAMTTVRDLLKMTSAFTHCDYVRHADWTEAFYLAQATHLPGQSFRYDTLATTMLCMIVKRVSGKEFTGYLSEKLFAPAGMNTDIRCIQSPCGHEWGGSGVLCTTRDLAKFAHVVLNGGRLDGKQLIPEDYIAAATSCQVDNTLATNDPEHQFGYGYQFWRNRHGYSCRGMGSQLAVFVPEGGFVLLTTADTQFVPSGCALIYDALWDEIYPHLKQDAALPANGAAAGRLDKYVAGLSLITVDGALTSPEAARVSGRTYALEDNTMKMTKVRFVFEKDEGVMEYDNATGRHSLRFGFGKQCRQDFPETHYNGMRIKTPMGRGYVCHSSAAWKMENSLLLYCYATDIHFGAIRMNIVFDGDTVTIQSEKAAEFFFNEYQGCASGAWV